MTPEYEAWMERARAVRIEDELARRGIRLKGNGKVERCGACPICSDGDDRFSINTKKQVWNCRKCRTGGDLIKLVKRLDGCGFEEACEKLTGKRPPRTNGKSNGRAVETEPKREVVETYPYHDADGVMVFETQRVQFRNPDGSFVLTKEGKPKKTFWQRRPDPKRTGEFIYDLDGVQLVPYGLPDLIRAVADGKTIYIVEAERKADLLRSLGLAATCNPMGAGKWPANFVTHFVDAIVVILPDNDKPGRDHARDVARRLHLARSIKIVELPELKIKEDVKEWLDRGGTVDALAALVADAPKWVDRPEPGSLTPKPVETATGTDEPSILNEIDAGVKVKGFPFTTYEEARTGSASPRWLLKFLLAYNERSGWVGPPGSLKSGILTALAYAVASGEDWCGKRNKGKCAVIYFALERADLVKRRLRAYADERGLADLPIVVVGQTVNFLDWNVAKEIIATIDEVEKRFGIKVGLLIIDTLAKAIAAGGGDENTAKDQGKVYANLDRVKEQRTVHVAIACHPGKEGGKGPRGSSASTGDFGVQIEISGTDERTATITKNNEGPLGHLASFRPKIHDFGKDEDGDSIDVCLAEEIGSVPHTVKTRLSVAEQAALDCLAEALSDKGVRPPIAEEIPPSVSRVVSADIWREYVRSRGITTSDLRDTQDKAFRRASQALQRFGRVGCWNDNIWIVERGTP